MTHFYKIICTILILLLLSCNDADQVDLIIHNAKIYTVNDQFDIEEAMAIKDGKIMAIGPEHEIMNKYSATEIIDAKQQTIFPGFIDAHCHFMGYGLGKKKVNLVGTNSFEEVIEKVKKFADSSEDEWIFGRGWDQNDWEFKEFPTKDKLDSLFPNRPVVLSRIDGHASLVNSEVLRRSKIDFTTQINGGAILQYGSGQQKNINIEINSENISDGDKTIAPLTGILVDKAMGLVSYKTVPRRNNKDFEEALLAAQKDLFEVGVTTVDDAGLGRKAINIIDSLHKEGKLKMKVYAMISGNEKMLEFYLEKGPYKTPKLNVRSFKFYADGALGSRGACLIKPYSDVKENDHYGLLTTEVEFFQKYAPLLYEKGFQMNVHCIGDSANRMILDVYAEVLKGVNDKRWRIEHAQVIHPEDFEKFKLYTIIPSIQSTHATSDMYWAKDRLGEERVNGAYAYKDLLNQNGIVALGTDFPVEGINPMNTFYAAVVRKDSKGYPDDGYQMENALTREEALRGMTIWAAVSNFEENEKGSLEVGKAADFVILNNNIMETNEKNLLNVKVVQTFIDGENVFSLKK
jgi:predicted amidohydrolase YtcJ